MTPQMFLAAASVYCRPIIVFSVKHKMAYFEKVYLPKADYGREADVVELQEPIYIYSHGDVRYKLMVHRNQKQMLKLLIAHEVKYSQFKVDYKRFEKYRIASYNKS